jgi:hypothetical protein
LPSTLSGVWEVTGAQATAQFTAISYLTQVEPAPELVYVYSPETFGVEYATVFNTETGATTTEEIEGAEAIEDYCGAGTISDPDAEPGYLCVFVATKGALPAADPPARIVSPDPNSGAILPVFLVESDHARGSWAVNTN